MGPVLGAEGQGWCVLSVCRVLSDVPSPRGWQAECCLLRWASRTASQGQPFPLSPHGPPWQQELSFVVGCQERASSLSNFKEWEGRAGRGSLYQGGPLPSLPQGCEDSPGERDGAALFEMFLTSFPAPGRGPASPSWGGPVFTLPSCPCPHPALPCWGSLSSQLLLATLHLDQLWFLSVLLPLKPALSPLPCRF